MVASGRGNRRPHREVQGQKPMMDDRGKSHNSVVPEKSPNKGQSAEGMEGRELAKGKTLEQNRLRTQGRVSVHSALERIREAAQKDKRQRFTALFHHVYSLELLRKSYFDLKRDAAPGIDGETWRHYGERLEEHLQDLSEWLKRGAYRARPVRRAYIPKTGRSVFSRWKTRSSSVPSLR
jgi:RNA-directed DNA polymerase